MKALDLVEARRAELAAQEAAEKERRQQVEAERGRLVRDVYQPQVVALLVGLGLDAEEIAAGVSLTPQTWFKGTTPYSNVYPLLSIPGFKRIGVSLLFRIGSGLEMAEKSHPFFIAEADWTAKSFDTIADALCFAQEVKP